MHVRTGELQDAGTFPLHQRQYEAWFTNKFLSDMICDLRNSLPDDNRAKNFIVPF